MNTTSLLKSAYFALLSRPAADRIVYRAIRRLRAAALVEIGLGDGLRARRMIEAARRYHPAANIRYTGIDLFEARADTAQPLSLKQAHRALVASGAHVKLVPGDPFSALARTANALTGTDLLVIAADADAESLERAWFYLPRILHDRSVVLWRDAGHGEGGFRPLALDEVRRRAGSHVRSRSAA